MAAYSHQRRFAPRFFVSIPEERALAAGTHVRLTVEDSHHAARVLRLRLGDECEVVTEHGAVYSAHVERTQEPLEVVVAETLVGARAGAVYRHEVGLVQALARPAAVDYVLEKATEVGAGFFVLFDAVGSFGQGRVDTARLNRWRRIVLEASKQSKQTRVPSVELVDSAAAALRLLGGAGVLQVVLELGAVDSLGDVVARTADGSAAYDTAEVSANAANSARTGAPAGGVRLRPKRGLRVALWIGPEGGWGAGELQLLTASGVRPARLGQSVLRTETAGPVAVAITRIALGDW